MKKITLLFILLITSIGFSQEVLQNFENGGLGEAFGRATASVVADPEAGGARGNVALLTAVSTGETWQGINITLTKNVQLTTDKTMSLDVYSNSAITIAPKVLGGLDSAPASTGAVTHTGSGWETLTLTFNQGLDNTVTANGVYSAFVIYYNWDAGTTNFIDPAINRVFYVDNISGNTVPTETDATISDLQVDATTISGFSPAVTSYDYEAIAGATVPTVTATTTESAANAVITQAAQIPGDATVVVTAEDGTSTKTYTVSFVVVPAPTDAPNSPPDRNAWDVISLYGEAYGTEIGLANTTWDNGADSEELTIASNKVLKVTNGTGQFVGFDIANTNGFVSATNMTHFHADFWIVGDYITGQTLNTTLSNHAGDIGTETNGIVLSKAIAGDGSENEKWVSVDLEIGTDDRERLAQLLFTYSAAAGATPDYVYFDNIYLYRAATADVDKNNLLNVSVSPSPTKDDLKISAQEIIENVTIYNVLGKSVFNTTIHKKEDIIDVSSLQTGIYILKYTMNNAVGTLKFLKE